MEPREALRLNGCIDSLPQREAKRLFFLFKASTGGVNPDTTADFLRADSFSVAVGGEWIDAQTIEEGKYEIFIERARQYIALIQKTRAEMAA